MAYNIFTNWLSKTMFLRSCSCGLQKPRLGFYNEQISPTKLSCYSINSKAVSDHSSRNHYSHSLHKRLGYAPRKRIEKDSTLSKESINLNGYRDQINVYLKNQPISLHQSYLSKRNIFLGTQYKTTRKDTKDLKSTENIELDPSNLSKEDEQKHENIITIPNLLCLSRIVAAPYLSHLIINQADFSWAMAIFMYAGLTDALDGWIARRFPSQRSSIGTFLDPLSDKIMMTTMYLSLAYVSLIPITLTALVVSRDTLLIYAGLHMRYLSLLPKFTMKKYFDLSLPSAQVLPTTISKVNTMVQLLLVAVALSAPIFNIMNHPGYYALCGLTAGTTFASAVSYAFSKSVYKFSYREHDHQYGKRIAVFIFFILFNIAFVKLIPTRSLENGNANKINGGANTSSALDVPTEKIK